MDSHARSKFREQKILVMLSAINQLMYHQIFDLYFYNSPANAYHHMTSLKDTRLDPRKTFEWPKHLRTPSELVDAVRLETKLRIIRSPLCSKLVLQFIGGWSYILANVLNRSYIYNWDVFNQELRRIEQIYVERNCSRRNNRESKYNIKRGPLITLSNHISCIDDPILWGALLPFNYYFTKTDSVRWSAAAIDICFSKPWHSTFFAFGKTFPIIRGIGLEQPAMEFASALLRHNEWLHLFPEGRVMRDHNQQIISNLDRGYIFKWGIAKLLLDHFKSPTRNLTCSDTNSEMRILPLYHIGMDKILPIGRPYIPRIGKKMTIYIRPSAISMDSRLLNSILSTRTLSPQVSKSRSSDEIMRIKLTNYLEEETEKLIEPATRLHENNK